MKTVKDTLVAFFGGLGQLVDTVAGIPSGDLQKEIGLIVVAASSVGLLHVANAPALVTSLTTIVVTVAAVGVAIERIVKATHPPAPPAPPTK